jgi:hypothetical protein
VGVDIDPTLEEEGIRSNFAQYGLPPLGNLIIGDAAEAVTIKGTASLLTPPVFLGSYATCS